MAPFDANGRLYPRDRRDLTERAPLGSLPYGDDHVALSMVGRDKRFAARDIVEFGDRVGVRAN